MTMAHRVWPATAGFTGICKAGTQADKWTVGNKGGGFTALSRFLPGLLDPGTQLVLQLFHPPDALLTFPGQP